MTKRNEFREMVRELREKGYEEKRRAGSHVIFSNGNHSVTINLKLNKMVAKRIRKEIEEVR